MNDAQDLMDEGSGYETVGVTQGLYESVLEGLKETRVSMRDLRAGMNEARGGT